MKKALAFVSKTVLGGLLVVVPIYLAILVLLKGMQAVGKLVKPIAQLLPEWFPAEQALSLLLVLMICFLIGLAVRTRLGQVVRERMENNYFAKIPGYGLFRNLTRQVAGDTRQNIWKPALVEMGDGLVLAFIIEEVGDSRYTIFVPSIPTPLAGAVYVLERERVHPSDVSFAQAIKAVSQWGSGAKDLVAAMEKPAIVHDGGR
ncbi:MAG: hypothetical protein V7642_6220 [Burkholderiales bacterium]|jgi:uncharacterized membrane protein